MRSWVSGSVCRFVQRVEPRSDIPTLLSDTNPTLVRHSDTSDSPTVRQSDSCPTAVRHCFRQAGPVGSVKQCQTVKHHVRQSDSPTVRHCPTVRQLVLSRSDSLRQRMRPCPTTLSKAPQTVTKLMASKQATECLLACLLEWQSRSPTVRQSDSLC